MKRIGIVGFGYVGKTMAKMFAGRYDIAIYDPAKGYEDDGSVRTSDLVLICVPTPKHRSGRCDVSAVAKSVDLEVW